MSYKTSDPQYLRMTGEPVGKLIRELAVPTILSMLVTNIYNMADTYFVSGLGTSASGATGVVFSLMAVLQAFGFMFGHGAGSNISRHLGAGHLDDARTYSAVSFYLSIAAGAIVGVVGIAFLDPFMVLLGSTPTILPYARIYGFYILIAGPAMTVSCVMNNILRYEGKAFYAMVGLTLGGVLNIFGDALLILGFHMGIGGAGLSTAVSQYISCVVLILPYLRGKTKSSFHPKYFKPTPHIVADIIMTGFPSLVRQGLNAVSTMVLNNCAGVYGDAAVAAVSICSRVVMFFSCITIGIGQGYQPVAAFNQGAGIYSRVKKGFFAALKGGLCVMIILAVISFVFAGPIVEIFRDDPEVIDIGTVMLRIEAPAIAVCPLSVFGDMMFQATGHAGRASLLAGLRRGILLIPILLILTHFFGLTGLEWSQGISEMLTALITLPLVASFFRTLPPDAAQEE